MVKAPSSRAPPRVRGPFERLGRFIVGHAKLVILVWVLLLIGASPLLLRLDSATTPSALSFPSNAPSSEYNAQLSREFPNSTVLADTLLLVSGPDITSSTGRNLTLNLTQELGSDPKVHPYANVETLYTSYHEFLNGIANASLAVLQEGFQGNRSAYVGVNGTAAVLWGTAGLYLQTWGAMVNNSTTLWPPPPVQTWNYPAYQALLSHPIVQENPQAVQNLTLFYTGYPKFSNSSVPNGWNSSLANIACWNKVWYGQEAVLNCTDTMVRALHADPVSAGIKGGGPFDPTVLAQMELENFSRTVRNSTGAIVTLVNTGVVENATLHFLAAASGIDFPALNATWHTFPSVKPNATTLNAWSSRIVERGVAANYSSYSVDGSTAMPPGILGKFVDGPANNLTVLVLLFHPDVPDDSNQAQGIVSEIDRLVPLVLASSASYRGYGFVQTGDAALVVTEANVINQDTDAILPITVALLLTITALYFRAPLTAVLVITTVGLALLLGLVSLVITAMIFGPVTQSALTLLLTFSLGVGTDYSVFLMARYREELWLGRTHEKALVNAVTWAGESIATSGSTVVLATLAMTMSGTQLIGDWGRVLSSGVTIALLAALTLVPAVLHLIGPRLFWPYTGERFERQAARRRDASRRRDTYFHRASRLATRRPAAVLLLAALLSMPLVYFALSAPLSYSYFGQLPPSQAPARGLTELAGNFGPGYVFPLEVLVTFQQPLVHPPTTTCPVSPAPPGGCTSSSAGSVETDPAGFAQANYLEKRLGYWDGVRSVDSLFGANGAPLSAWLNLSTDRPVPQQELLATFGNYVGADARTLHFTVSLDANGNSNTAVSELNAIEGNLTAYAQAHAGTVSAIYYGGAPSETRDLQVQLSDASLRMELVIVVGLLIVLFVALGSVVLPPLALITIALSAAWSWALSFVVFVLGLNLSLFFYIPPVLFLLIMGLGMDYNIFILTRIREERLKGKAPKRAVVDAVAHTAGIITAAAVILGGAFFALVAAQVTLLRVLGFAVGAAVILDAAVVRTYLVPAILGAAGDRIWWSPRLVRGIRKSPADAPLRRVAKAPLVPSPSPLTAAPFDDEVALEPPS